VYKGVYAMVEQLRSGRLSRNRNFALFAAAEARRAQRVHRRLCGLERELALPDTAVTIEPAVGTDRFAITLEHPALRLRRVAYVAAEELAFLCEDPRVRARLGGPA